MLADDHAVVRTGLRTLIEHEPDLEVVAESCDAKSVIAAAQELKPDVVVLDLSMPGGGGLRAIPRIREACRTTRVIVLTMHDDPAYVRSVLASGGWGYVLKNSADIDVIRAIRTVQRGRRFVDAALAGMLLSEVKADKPSFQLSARELDVLRFLAQGQSYQIIAERLNLSTKTVESYRARISQKLGFRTRAELVRYALMTGLLSSEDAHLQQ
ncbi:MAG TPA: response regulator transcription factor [Candidatus Angelobacter sp.]|jgi:DNA-binding NarL/FixJ family response regulator|nr:response regulator transcription factor [Candidatus Angelobacter sp.]